MHPLSNQYNSISPQIKDEMIQKCGILALRTNSKIVKDIYFALGGTVNKINFIWTRLPPQELKNIHFDINDWKKFKEKSNLEDLAIYEIFQSSKQEQNIAGPAIQAFLKFEFQENAGKIKNQFKHLFESIPSIENKVLLIKNIKEILIKSDCQEKIDMILDQIDKNDKLLILKKLIELGDLTTLEAVIKIPEDLNLVDSTNNTLLIHALIFCEEKIVNFLLEKGADCNKKGMGGKVPLMFAKDKDTMQLLIAKGANIEERDEKGLTPLMEACKEGNFEAAKYLISLGVNLNVADNQEVTPLKYAALKKNYSLVELLIDNGADINAKNSQGITTLISSFNLNDLYLVNLLINKGADINSKDNEGSVPLVYSFHNFNIFKLLIEKGANPNEKDNNGKAILKYVLNAQKNKYPMIKLLIDSGADVNSKDKEGITLLMYAATGDLNIVKLLIERGADIDAKDNNGGTALNYAINGKKFEIFKFLIDQRANYSNWYYGLKPIHQAIIEKFSEAEQELLRHEKYPIIPFFFILEKVFCHRFGVDLQFQTKNNETVHLEGFTDSYFLLNEVCCSLKQFILSIDLKDDSIKNFLQETLEILSSSNKNKENLQEALNNDIFAILTGYQGHATGIVVSPDQNLLIKADRGGNTTSPGLHVYHIGKPEKLKEVLEKVVEHEQESSKYYEETMNQELDLLEIESQYLEHSDQSAGNCMWASAKLLLRGIMYLKFLGMENSSEAANRSYDLYKEWTQFDRHFSTEQFLKHLIAVETIQKLQNLSEDDLKDSGIIIDDILNEVVFKCINDRFLDTLKAILSAKPHLIQALKNGYNLLFYAYLKGQNDAYEFIKSIDDGENIDLANFIDQIMYNPSARTYLSDDDLSQHLMNFYDNEEKAQFFLKVLSHYSEAFRQEVIEYFTSLDQASRSVIGLIIKEKEKKRLKDNNSYNPDQFFDYMSNIFRTLNIPLYPRKRKSADSPDRKRSRF